MDCQLKQLDEIKQKNSKINEIIQIRVKILRPAKRKLIFLKNRLINKFYTKRNKKNSAISSHWTIKPGDLVRVRSKEEIKSMLDDHEKYKGCLFIDEMYEYCGNSYKVLKKIDYFYDEAKQKMCKAKDSLILEGVVCSGRQRLYKVSCDRNCFFFWNKDWLEKV